MMKVRAKHNFKHNGEFHKGNSVFHVESIDGIENYVDVLDAPAKPIPKVEPTEEKKAESKPKRKKPQPKE